MSHTTEPLPPKGDGKGSSSFSTPANKLQSADSRNTTDDGTPNTDKLPDAECLFSVDNTSNTSASPLPTDSDNDNERTVDATCSSRWSAFIKSYHGPLIKGLLAISRVSARNPLRTVCAVIFISFFLITVGYFTNFDIEASENKMWTPVNSISNRHRRWVRREADFPNNDRYFPIFFHANGGNVLKKDYVAKVFDVMDTLRNHSDYDSVCAESDRIAPDGIYVAQEGQNRTCEISGIPAFFSYQRSIFDLQVQNDEDVITYLSLKTYPDFRPVSRSAVMGKAVWAKDESGRKTDLLESAESYTLAFVLPDTDEAEEWDLEMLDVVFDFKEKWAREGSDFVVEAVTDGSFSLEFARTITADLPLVPIVFIVMSSFTALVFAKRHKVESRSVLGFAAVFCVMLSIMSGYGLVFCFGVPFTSMTQLLPFLIFGIGLDDAFIVTGAYIRTDHRKDPVERIEETIEDIGLSITLTTTTSATAFALGCLSSVPTVYWLVLYAFPSIIIVFFYQLTFFVACIVLDERRMAANRRDCCCWVKATETHRIGVKVEGQDHIADRFMAWLGSVILQPKIKVLVIVVFLSFAGFCGWRASLLEQRFSVRDVLPDGSYMRDFIDATEFYTDEADVRPKLYFRYVDQSNKTVQDLMFDYVDTIVALDQVSEKPTRFWLDHFQEFVNAENLTSLAFNEQVDKFLDDPVYRYIHYDDIYRDEETGNIIASRVAVSYDQVGYQVVKEEIEALKDTQRATAEFEINQGLDSDDWPFFAYTGDFTGWEFYAVCVQELILTTVIGVISVTCIAVIIIPHWTAGPIVLPFIVILYVDLLGVAQMAGVYVNAVSYIGLTMSIGLLVDFIMHCLLRYYEVPGTRREKCVEMLRTMGASILLGGISTFLGIMLLVFASSDIFFTIFVIFCGIVVLGVSHGLILLPVVLSIIGPEDQVTTSLVKKEEEPRKPLEKKVLIYI